MPIARNSTDDELLAAVRAWIELLSESKYLAALQRIPSEPDESWTPQLLEEVVAGYGLPQASTRGNLYQVTSVSSATGHPSVASVEREALPPGAVAYIEHSLPLNGKWSDLTATFVLFASDSEASLFLREVHVF